MPNTSPPPSFHFIFILLFALVCPLKGIIQQCTQTNTSVVSPIEQDQSHCPPISFCGTQGLCVCDLVFFGNCQTQGQFIDSQSKNFTITENYSFFLIEPLIDEFVNFQFIICNANSLDNTELLNMWVDDGNLTTPTPQNALARDK